MPTTRNAPRVIAQRDIVALPTTLTLRTKRGPVTVTRRAKGTRPRGAIPRQLRISGDRAQIRDFAARVAERGAHPSTVLVSVLLALSADYETGNVDPKWTQQEQLARFGVSVASIRRAENWLVKHGFLMRERVQVTRRHRMRVLRVLARPIERKSAAHGERRMTAHGERLGEHPKENSPPDPPSPAAAIREVARTLPRGAPPLPLHPPHPDPGPEGPPPGADDRPCGPRVYRPCGPTVEPVDASAVDSSRAGSCAPRTPAPEPDPEASKGLPRDALAVLERAPKPWASGPRREPVHLLRAAEAPIGRDAFMQVELDLLPFVGKCARGRRGES